MKNESQCDDRKECFEAPQAELILFSAEDVIAASGEIELPRIEL